ncbi:MAG: T9SS type A sorting domain-containing protein [Bacteroidia bacterium]
MKKNILVLLMSLLMSSLQSQTTYYKLLDKDTTTWQHFNCAILVGNKTQNSSINPFDRPIVAVDTIIINSYKYKKVYELQAYSINYTGKMFFGYMREDTVARKVYFRETVTSPEYLLYDFSLNVNDSIQLTFPNNASFNGYYRADSIVTKTEKCGPRKHFYIRKHLNNSQPSVNYIEYIESIGSTMHTLYLYNPWCITSGCMLYSNTCKHNWTVGLSCKHNNLKKQYQSCTFMLAQMNSCMNPVDSCNYRNSCGGLKSNSLPAGITVFPNPAKEYVAIKFDDNSSHSLNAEISDLAGKLIITRKESGTLKEVKINFNGIEKGLYILKIKVDGETFSPPLFIEE